MFDTIKDLTKETVNMLDPIGKEMGKKDKEIIETLLKAGFKKKNIKSFTKVYQDDIEEYVTLLKEIEKRTKPATKKRSTTRRTTTAA